MILFNTTIKVDHDIREEFLEWIRKEHFVDCLNSGMVHEAKTYRLLGTEEEDGITYSLQYRLQDIGNYENFVQILDKRFKIELHNRYGIKQVSFSSVLEMV